MISSIMKHWGIALFIVDDKVGGSSQLVGVGMLTIELSRLSL